MLFFNPSCWHLPWRLNVEWQAQQVTEKCINNWCHVVTCSLSFEACADDIFHQYAEGFFFHPAVWNFSPLLYSALCNVWTQTHRQTNMCVNDRCFYTQSPSLTGSKSMGQLSCSLRTRWGLLSCYFTTNSTPLQNRCQKCQIDCNKATCVILIFS